MSALPAALCVAIIASALHAKTLVARRLVDVSHFMRKLPVFGCVVCVFCFCVCYLGFLDCDDC